MLKEYRRQFEKVPTGQILENLNMKIMIAMDYILLNKTEKHESIYT